VTCTPSARQRSRRKPLLSNGFIYKYVSTAVEETTTRKDVFCAVLAEKL
jgi:hypothetical protein